jgi:hypothetical protein
MNDTLGSATAAVVFNLPLVMTNLITVVAKRRLLDTRRTYPIIAALWAVMLVALIFHYISTKAYDNRVSTATAAQIRIRVQRCLRILKKHVKKHSLKIDSQRADSQNLIRAYNDVRFLTDELRIYCSPADVEVFRAKIGPLKKALQDYAVSIGALQQMASVGGTAATDALLCSILYSGRIVEYWEISRLHSPSTQITLIAEWPYHENRGCFWGCAARNLQ